MSVNREIFQGWRILNAKEKNQVIWVLVSGIGLAVVEIFVISLIFPVIQVISKNSNHQGLISHVFNVIGANTAEQRISAAFLLIFIAYLLRTATYLMHKHLLARIRKNLFVKISTRLYESYISKGIEYHQAHNSSELIRNIYGVATYLNNYVFGVVNLCSEVFLGVGLVALLLIQSATTTAIIVVLCYFGSRVVHRITKSEMINAGKQVSEFTAKRYEILQDGFDGISELKIYNKEKAFSDMYASFHQETAEAERKFEFYSGVTSPVFELLIVTSISVAMVAFTTFGNNAEAIIPVMAVYVAVAFRFIPSFGRIIGIFQQFDYGRAISEIIGSDLETHIRLVEPSTYESSSEKQFSDSVSIDLENVTFSYLGTNETVVKNLSLRIEQNKIYGFVGKSGAGKSTLVKLISGLLVPTYGRITVNGIDIAENLKNWQATIGYVPQRIFLMDSSLKENVEFGLDNEVDRETLIQEALETAGLRDFIELNAEGIHYQIGERGVRLSGGQQQRVGIARAMSRRPTLLILDEATSGLDKTVEEEILKTITKLRGKLTVIIISHSKEVLEYVDEVIDLDKLNDSKL
jgi:ABC-type multidrug transport system fused ATPase/permease subunit